MRQEFNFEVTADASGCISLAGSGNLPVKVKIKTVGVLTRSGCRNRTHVASVSTAAGVLMPPLTITDCAQQQASPNVELQPGNTSGRLEVDGFDSGEIVRGEAFIEYSISLFARENEIIGGHSGVTLGTYHD